jgi:hypothetical protein
MDAIQPIPGLDPEIPGPSAVSLAGDLAFVGLVRVLTVSGSG